MSETALEVLRRVWGYPAFRGEQAAIVERLIAGGDALVLMPTGGGKSLCYQLPALLRPGTAIVISPLIALMQDQVDALIELGVRAAFLNSSLSADAAYGVEQRLLNGDLDLLYVAPERLLTGRFLSLIERIPIALFAIDEAHCVSQWGHDFRREYRELNLLHERFPQVPRIALTATADEPTRREIVEHLQLSGARQFISSFDRPNIRYRVTTKHNAGKQLLDFLKNHSGEAGIVYCLSRRSVDDTAAALVAQGHVALPYHAGMSGPARAANQRRFLLEDGVIVVATIAFGMGIDKPDVRFVVHLDLPKSIEGYYQETGRAGRDGEPAEAFLCYGIGDLVSLGRMIAMSESSEERKRLERRKLDILLGYCESIRCRRQVLLENFGETHAGHCGNCDNCLQPPQTWDATVAVQKALSCVFRTGQRFGVVHLIDVLRGKATEKISQFGHDSLPTFGIGADLDDKRWRSVFRQLVAAGLLEVDGDGYGGLRFTAASRAALKGEQPIQMRHDAELARGKDKDKERSRGDRAQKQIADLTPAAGERFLRLKELRAQLARAHAVPAYVIFHDATLRAIASENPADLDELGAISGVGANKLQRYGAAVLDALS